MPAINEVTQRRRLRPPQRWTAHGRVAEAVVFGGRVLSLGETGRDRGDDEWLVRREIGETSRLVRLNELPGRLVSPMAPDTRAVDTGGSQMNENVSEQDEKSVLEMITAAFEEMPPFEVWAQNQLGMEATR